MEQISRENPETPTNTIRGSEWNLDAVKPKTISKPSRGVFKPKNVVGDVNVGIEATDQIVGADQIVSIPPEAVSFKTYTAKDHSQSFLCDALLQTPLLTCSFGLLAPPSSHEFTLATVTVCCSSGAFTRIVNRVAGPKVVSAKPLCRNAAMVSTAASYMVAADT